MVPTRRRLLALILVAGGAVVVAGCGQPRSQSATSTPASSPLPRADDATALAAAAVDPDHAGPTTVVDGVPMGFAPGREGAVAAGLSFARFNQALVEMTQPQAAAARRAMGTEEAAGDLADDVVDRLSQIRARWPLGSLHYRVAPLAVRAAEAGPGAMDVDVWYVAVVEAPDRPPYEEWVTESFRLVWERDDWRLDSLAETRGPRPHPGPQQPASPAEFKALLAGFEPLP